jgi:ABC-type phosphate transport system permease subunit
MVKILRLDAASSDNKISPRKSSVMKRRRQGHGLSFTIFKPVYGAYVMILGAFCVAIISAIIALIFAFVFRSKAVWLVVPPAPYAVAYCFYWFIVWKAEEENS